MSVGKDQTKPSNPIGTDTNGTNATHLLNHRLNDRRDRSETKKKLQQHNCM